MSKTLPQDGKALQHDGEVLNHNGEKETSSGACEEPMEWERDWTKKELMQWDKKCIKFEV